MNPTKTEVETWRAIGRLQEIRAQFSLIPSSERDPSDVAIGELLAALDARDQRINELEYRAADWLNRSNANFDKMALRLAALKEALRHYAPMFTEEWDGNVYHRSDIGKIAREALEER